MCRRVKHLTYKGLSPKCAKRVRYYIHLSRMIFSQTMCTPTDTYAKPCLVLKDTLSQTIFCRTRYFARSDIFAQTIFSWAVVEASATPVSRILISFVRFIFPAFLVSRVQAPLCNLHCTLLPSDSLPGVFFIV